MNTLLLLSLLVLFVVLILAWFWSQSQQDKHHLEIIEERTWLVQCPHCHRWKSLKPIASDLVTDLVPVTTPPMHPGAQYKYTNQYKCPFCGHQWQENYLE